LYLVSEPNPAQDVFPYFGSSLLFRSIYSSGTTFRVGLEKAKSNLRSFRIADPTKEIPLKDFRKLSRAVSRVGVLSIIIGSLGVGVASAPAYANGDPLDASGVQFSFINATDVLAVSETGDTFEYVNVATIGAVQIDATLTIEESFNLFDYYGIDSSGDNYFFLDEAAKDLANDFDDGRETLVETGCYLGEFNETTLASDYLVGSDTFNQATAWNAGSKFLVGSTLEFADEALEDDAEDRAINTSMSGCGGVVFYPAFLEYSFPAYVRYTIDFTSGGNPVELINLTLSAFDIDGGQYLRLFSPMPDSYRVYDPSFLEICGPISIVSIECADEGLYAGSASFLATTIPSTLEFYAEDSSEENEIFEYAAEATYTQATDTISYQFGVRSGGGGSLAVQFDPIDFEAGGGSSGGSVVPASTSLASTGASEQILNSSTVSLITIGIGFALMLVAGRMRRASRRP
jgi:hypothetical protein